MQIPVSVVRCDSYDYSAVSTALEECLREIGGIGRFVKPGYRVVLKVNLLNAADPIRAVTTHPSVVAAVAKMIREVGGEAMIVDSPGVGARYTPGSLREIYHATGMVDAASKGDAKLNYDTSFRSVSIPTGKLVKRFEIIKPILEADAVINLPKFKTHGFTYLTAAVKNLFGVLPGKTKVGYHATLKNIRNFSEMLIDLLLYVNPCLTIVDAIVGMDGDGPSAGRARKLGLLLASENPLAVDIVLAEAVKVDPALIPHIRAALDRKLSPQSLKDVKVLGETFESIRVPDFVMPKSMERKGRLGTLSLLDRLTAPFLKDMFSVRPEIIPEVCTGCRICEENCPENAIRLVHAKAHINQRRCIRCYCCHELCPSRSVELRKNPLQTLGKMIR